MLVDLYSHYEALLRDEIAAAGRDGAVAGDLDTGRISVEQPRDPSHGDLATNAAMVLAKQAGQPPRALAELLAGRLQGRHGIESAEVAGPGFINLRLEVGVWHQVLRSVLQFGDAYGAVDLGRGEAVNVEYVSANPTGPMHVGHCRGAVVGDALANLLAFTGHRVTREYYINDAGVQIDTLARSAYLRYGEALGDIIDDIPPGLYPGDYLKPVGEQLAADHGEGLRNMEEGYWLPIVREVAIERMMTMIREDLARLGIRHDVFTSERSLNGPDGDKIAEVIDLLRERNLIYEGRLPPPKGQLPDDWEDREQTLFRSTEFGDDIDRPLKKSDGSYTYFAADIAYHFDKFRRGFTHMIDVWGADHGGYIKRMKAAVAATTEGRGHLDVLICQLVRLFRGGKSVGMSKRAGEFVTLAEVVDEVGLDPIRFMMLYRKSDAPLDFDFAKVTERSRDNPVFYVQYAYARARSVLRNAREMCPESIADDRAFASAPIEILVDPAELDVVRRLAQFPRMIEGAARAHEPHRVAFFLYELASAFHALWNRGKELPHLRFIQPAVVENTDARLALVRSVAYVLQTGLGVLGVSAPEEMD